MPRIDRSPPGAPGASLARAFDFTLIAKGIDGALEIVGSALLYLVPADRIGGVLGALTQHELIHARHGILARSIEGAAGHFSASSQSFAALFLLWHGLIKIVLVIALLRRELWAYPFGIAAFGLFLVYQLHRYLHTHSTWLLALSVLDLLIVVLTGLEWRRLWRERVRRPPAA